MKENIYKHKNGMWVCELKETEYPHSNVLAFGENPTEAKQNAWDIRRKIIDTQLSVKPIIIKLNNHENI